MMTLKTKNMPYIIGFIVLMYVGFAIANGMDWDFANDIKITKGVLEFQNPLLTILFPLVAVVLTFVLQSQWKDRIIYLRWNYPLPGTRIFTELIDKDARITRSQLEEAYGELPVDPAEQNALWYKISKEKESERVVRYSHGRWLLLRDLFSIALLLSIPAIVYTYWKSGFGSGSIYGILYLVFVIIFWISARNAGVRFACNVLAR
jgi:hypothetical protein